MGANRLTRMWTLLTGLAAVLLISPLSFSAPPFERGAFNQIEFSPACAQKQWTLAPDTNALELLVAPQPQEECRVTLPFYLAQVGMLRFRVQRNDPLNRQPFAFSFQLSLMQQGDPR